MVVARSTSPPASNVRLAVQNSTVGELLEAGGIKPIECARRGGRQEYLSGASEREGEHPQCRYRSVCGRPVAS